MVLFLVSRVPQALANVRWLQHTETGELVPIVGTLKDFAKTARTQQEDGRFEGRSFEQFMSAPGKLAGNGEPMKAFHKWEKVQLSLVDAAAQLQRCSCAGSEVQLVMTSRSSSLSERGDSIAWLLWKKQRCRWRRRLAWAC